MAEAAPAEHAAVAEKKRSLLRRVPTSLIVTLLGIALTAWLLPAFTRQWDDRQKAHELQASLVTGIASATARALTDMRDSTFKANSRPSPSTTGLRLGVSPLSASERAWSVERFQIEAKLRAYFPETPVSLWRIYGVYVGLMIADSSGRAVLTVPRSNLLLGELTQAENHAAFKPPFSDALPLLGTFERTIERYRDDARRHAKPEKVARDASSVLNAYVSAANELLSLEEKVADSILAARVNGYSATAHDLLRDLIP